MGYELSLEEICVSLFCRERFASSDHIPFFLQNFAPFSVQRAVKDEQAQAVLKSASLALNRQQAKLLAQAEVNPAQGNLADGDFGLSRFQPVIKQAGSTAKSALDLPPQAQRTFTPEMLRQKQEATTVYGHKEAIAVVQSAQQAAEHDAVQESALAEAAWLSQTRIPSQTARNQIATIAIGSMYDFDELCVAVRYALEEDRVKLTMSSAFRSLQQRTQVFPLDINASTRSRLTHSFETSVYVKLCITALVERIPKLRTVIKELETCADTAALLHDIGNPPFGHFGEQVIRTWVAKICKKELSAVRKGAPAQLNPEQMDDLCAFNGNAQGLRLLHSLFCLNLSLGQLAAFMKMPYTCAQMQAKGLSLEQIQKRTGVFLSEEDLLERIVASNLGAKRHPLSLIMEQCDDLAYALADLEDAYDREVLKDADVFDLVEDLITHLKNNACYSSCDNCVSVCACAQGTGSEVENMSAEVHAAEAAQSKAVLRQALQDEATVAAANAAKVQDSATTTTTTTGEGSSGTLAQLLVNSLEGLIPKESQLSPVATLGEVVKQSPAWELARAAVKQQQKLQQQTTLIEVNDAQRVTPSEEQRASTHPRAKPKDMAATAGSNPEAERIARWHSRNQKLAMEEQVNREADQAALAAARSRATDRSASSSDIMAAAHLAHAKVLSDHAQQQNAAQNQDSSNNPSPASSTALQIKSLHPVKLDEVLLDVIHQAYCHYKDDAFGVLKLVHDNTTHSVRSMMRELGVPRLLYLLRDCLSSYYILDVVDAIVADEVGFFCEGILNIPPYANDAHKAVQFLKHYEQYKVYTHRQVESLELQGAAILKGVLRAYEPLLALSAKEFQRCLQGDGGDMMGCHLLRRIALRNKEAYKRLVKAHPLAEKYARIRLIIDHVAGMTDTFAAHEYSVLTGTNMSFVSGPL